MIVASGLEQKMKKNGDSIRGLADKLSIHPSTIENVLRAKGYNITVLDSLCGYYKCQPKDLITFVIGNTATDYDKRKWYKALKNKRFDKLFMIIEQKQWTIREAGRQLGVNDFVLFKMRRGKGAGYETVDSICTSLNCKLSDICEWEE